MTRIGASLVSYLCAKIYSSRTCWWQEIEKACTVGRETLKQTNQKNLAINITELQLEDVQNATGTDWMCQLFPAYLEQDIPFGTGCLFLPHWTRRSSLRFRKRTITAFIRFNVLERCLHYPWQLRNFSEKKLLRWRGL